MTLLISAIRNTLVIVGMLALGWAGYSWWQQRQHTSATVITVGPAVLEQVRHVNKQIFVEHYQSVEVSYVEAPKGWIGFLKKFGVSQNAVILIKGRVPAGIDVSRISEDDIWVSPDGRGAQLTLPPPRIFDENIAIDTEQSRIITESDYCPHMLCPTSQLEAYARDIEPEARRRLIQAAEEAGILQQAADDAQNYYQTLLNGLGIAEVRVIVQGYQP